MNFKPGDKVSFLNELGQGKVLKILSSESILIETDDGFEQSYSISELVCMKKQSDYKMDEILFNESVQEKMNSDQKSKEDDNLKRKFNHINKRSNNFELKMDLHIEELIDSHSGLSNYQIIQLQIKAFIRGLDNAIEKNANKFIVIHGIGQGVLKSEIKKELHDNYPEYKYYDVDYTGGATEIILK